MKHRIQWMSALLVTAAVCTGVATARASDKLVGDAASGQAKSATCAACHGADGNSSTPMWPKIAGQTNTYLMQQLKAFRLGATDPENSKARVNASMTPMAANLTDQDIADLAAYFTSQETKLSGTPKEFVELGQKIYRGGIAEKGVAACIACHGPKAKGVDLAGFPSLSGQHADYTIAQLKAYRDGSRVNMMMNGVAERMSDAEIEAIAHYVAGLH